MDDAASDGYIGHAGGMTDLEETVVARAVASLWAECAVPTECAVPAASTVCVDTSDGVLAALHHTLGRHAEVPAAGCPDASSTTGFTWRLALHRATPSPVPGADDAIVLAGPADGSVPRLLEHLLEGVTRGRTLVVVEHVDTNDMRRRSEHVVGRGGRSSRRRTSVLESWRADVPADATIEHTVRAIAVRAARTLDAVDPHLRLDALPGDVHEARGAVRRVRDELHAMGHVLRPGRADRLRGELSWFGGVLGAVRDLDVVLEHLHESSISHDSARLLRMRLRNERRLAALVLRNALASTRVRRLYDELLELATEPWLAKGVDPQRKVRRAALEAVRITDRRSSGAVRSIGDPLDLDRLLEVRRRAKACRHVCELVAAPLGSDRLAEAMLGVQVTLGRLQDAVTIDAWLAELHRPPLDPAAVEATTALAARAREQREAALAAWPAAWVRAQADALRPWVT